MMKKISLLSLSIFAFGYCSAQWAQLVSGSNHNLHDVDFLNENYGVVVGDTSTILLTTDGGMTWASIYNSPNPSIMNAYAVEVINIDTIVVALHYQITNPQIAYTTDGGISWVTNIWQTDPFTNHEIDIEAYSPSLIFGLGSSLVSTSDYGVTIDTLATNTGGTTSLSELDFTGSVGYASGLQSGFITYSASFLRTANSGATWYPYNPFALPNADALTAMTYISEDTAMMFTNHYAGFMPGTQNGLVRLTNFNLTTAGGPDSVFDFSSLVINSAMPSYINDGYFQGNVGYAAALDGDMYKTINGGMTWTSDYSGIPSLNKIKFIEAIGYAVGDNGTIIKLDSATTGISKNENTASISVYPNPVKDVLYISGFSGNTDMKYSIYNVNGKLVEESVTVKENGYDVSSFQPGIYFLELKDHNENHTRIKWVKQ